MESLYIAAILGEQHFGRYIIGVAFIEVMHGAWFQAKMLATVAIHGCEWQEFFYTEVIVKFAQLIDALMQYEELLCSKLRKMQATD